MNSTYFLNLVMGNLFGTQTSTPLPTEYYLGLATSAPTAAGACSGEISADNTGYSRVKLTGLSAPASGVIHNNSPISFPQSTAAWGTVTHYAVFDAATGGNLLFFGELEPSRTVETSTTLSILPSALTITLSDLGG